MCMHLDSHAQLPNICLCPLLFLFRFCFFGDVAFSEYFCTIIIAVSFLYGEDVVRSPLPDVVFLPCDHRLDFDINLCEN